MLWCPYSKFSKYLIGRDVNLDESIMLSLRNAQFDVENNPNVKEQVEFEPKVYGSIEKKLLVKLNDEEIQYLDNKENAP